MKRRTRILLSKLIGTEQTESIDKVDHSIYSMLKPIVFGGKDGREIKHIKGFEETCILLNQHIPKDPKKMTVLAFYQALETVQNQIKERKKANSRR